MTLKYIGVCTTKHCCGKALNSGTPVIYYTAAVTNQNGSAIRCTYCNEPIIMQDMAPYMKGEEYNAETNYGPHARGYVDPNATGAIIANAKKIALETQTPWTLSTAC